MTHHTANMTCKTSQRTIADLLVHSTCPLRYAKGKHPFLRRETLSHTDVKLQVTWTHTGKNLNSSDLILMTQGGTTVGFRHHSWEHHGAEEQHFGTVALAEPRSATCSPSTG